MIGIFKIFLSFIIISVSCAETNKDLMRDIYENSASKEYEGVSDKFFYKDSLEYEVNVGECKGAGCDFNINYDDYTYDLATTDGCKSGIVNWKGNSNGVCYGELPNNLNNGESFEISSALNGSVGSVSVKCVDSTLIKTNESCLSSCSPETVFWGAGCATKVGYINPGESRHYDSNLFAEFIGSATMSCQDGVINISNPVCKKQETYYWEAGPWSNCEGYCQDSVKTRAVNCVNVLGQVQSEHLCKSVKPETETKCTSKCFKGCDEIKYNNPDATSGVYFLNLNKSDPDSNIGEKVYCNMDLQGGGWTAILQRRQGVQFDNTEFGVFSLGEMLNNGVGDPSDVSRVKTASYAMSLNKRSVLDKKEYMLYQHKDFNIDLGEGYIFGFDVNTEVFPLSTGHNYLYDTKIDYLESMDGKYHSKDIVDTKEYKLDSNLYFRYAPISWIHSARCNQTAAVPPQISDPRWSMLKGMYGVCSGGILEPHIEKGAIDSVFGTRSSYHQVKLFGYDNITYNGSKDMGEIMYVRSFNPELKSRSKGASCSEIKENDINAASGIYVIEPSKNKFLEIYCNMDDDNGGWELLANYKDSFKQITPQGDVFDETKKSVSYSKAHMLNNVKDLRFKVVNDTTGEVVADWYYKFGNPISLADRDIFRRDSYDREWLDVNGVVDLKNNKINDAFNSTLIRQGGWYSNFGFGLIDIVSKMENQPNEEIQFSYSLVDNFSGITGDLSFSGIYGSTRNGKCLEFLRSTDDIEKSNPRGCLNGDTSHSMYIYSRSFKPKETVLPYSCLEIKIKNPNATDGYYNVLDKEGNIREVLCNMTTDGGGWTLAGSYMDSSFFKNAFNTCVASATNGNICDEARINERSQILSNQILSWNKDKAIKLQDQQLKVSLHNKDAVSYVGWNLGFSEMMVSNNLNEFISYSAPGSNSLKFRYDEMTKKRAWLEEFKKINTNITYKTNYWDDLNIRLMSTDIDSPYTSKWQGNYNFMAWKRYGNNPVHWDDGGTAIVHKRMGGWMAPASNYIDIWVREYNPVKVNYSKFDVKSCYELREKYLISTDGYYTLSPKKGKNIIVYCDMENGGLTTKELGFGYNFGSVGARTKLNAMIDSRSAERYCRDMGLNLYVPRSKYSFKKDRIKYGSEFFTMMGIYPNKGASSNVATVCVNKPFESNTCPSWGSVDGSSWYVSEITTSAEPNGYNTPYYSMKYFYDVNGNISHYNDIFHYDPEDRKYENLDSWYGLTPQSYSFVCSSPDDKKSYILTDTQ